MKRLLSSSILLALIGVVSAADISPNETPLVRLQAVWRDDLSKRDAFKPHKQQLAEQLFETERVIVRETTGREAFDRIDGTLRPSERSLILLGDLQQLRQQPKLTEIHNPGTFGNGFSAYVAPNGKLSFLWIIPEG
jgi:hypothetical protein